MVEGMRQILWSKKITVQNVSEKAEKVWFTIMPEKTQEGLKEASALEVK